MENSKISPNTESHCSLFQGESPPLVDLGTTIETQGLSTTMLVRRPSPSRNSNPQV